MLAISRYLGSKRQIIVAVALVSLLSIAASAGFNLAWAGDGPTKSKGAGRIPKLRELVEIPEDYVDREFTFKVRVSTNNMWMKRVRGHFFVYLEDEDGTLLPARGISPDATVNLIRFILPMDQARKLMDALVLCHNPRFG